MKSFLPSAAAIAAIVASAGVESFAPPSRRAAIVTSSSTPSPRVHRPPPSPSNPDQPRLDVPSYLFSSNDDSSSEEAADVNPSRRSRFLSNIRRKSKPITLALLAATSLRFGPTFLAVPPAKASAPIVLRENAKKEDPPMVQAQKKAEEIRKKKSLEEFDSFMARANDVEESEGKAARVAFEKEYQIEKEAKEAQKKRDVESLKRKLLDEGMDPHTDVDAERQVWLLEHDVDLEKISGTPQNERMIKNFQKRGKGMKTYKSQRYIISCQVADLKARGVDPMAHFGEREVMEKTRAIYKMDDKVADKVAAQYESLMSQYGGRLTPSQGETPFVYSADGDSSAGGAGAAVAAGSSAKEEKAAAGAAAREARLAEKEAAREARATAKAERAEARAQAKADKAAAAEAKKAEAAAAEAKKAEKAAAAAAGAAASSAASVASTAASSIADDDIAATANGDMSAAAGNNAVAKSSVEKTAAPSKSGGASKAKDVLSTVKSYATPRNVATVVIGGAAINYGVNYYNENNAGAQAEREAQLKLILGNDDEEEDEDDEFDDDDEDAYEQFTKKKPAPPKSEPKADEAPKAAKPPPTPPPVPVPAPKPKRKLGIFAKRNANARETDLNALIAPTAQAPEFAKLLSQILTFGAPGRFPAVASWGEMPFEEFELEAAKGMLVESRTAADLTDEQSAEIFASVVNCMIIDIVDLASAALTGKNKDEKVAVDAINVVMDFMDHAASLFDAVAKDVTIKPVTYGGNLRKKDLEQMFSVYAGSSMMSMDALTGGGGASQDRVDTLQLVFAITDKKAEGLMQKHMMKMMINLMKDGGKGLEGMMPEGMEGMEDMMKMMGGEGGMGLPGMDGEVSPEELKQTLGMMKDLMDSGQVSEEELAEVRSQFREMYGSDISDLIKKAQEEGAGEGMTEDERELLDLFKRILGED